MAMRIFSEQEWIEELKTRWKLHPTGNVTATTEIWLTPKGKAISVPKLDADDGYPDSLLYHIEDQLNKLGENPFPAIQSDVHVTR